MFGLSKKERTAEALKRGTTAIMNGAFFHINEAENYGLNEAASAWVYTKAQALQIYILVVVFNNTLGRKHSWATPYGHTSIADSRRNLIDLIMMRDTNNV